MELTKELLGKHLAVYMTNREIGTLYGISERTVERRRAEWRGDLTNLIPKSSRALWDKPPELHGDGVLLTFDYHIEFHDAKLIDLALRFQDRWQLPLLIIGGDFVDEEGFSSFVPDVEASFPNEIKVGRQILNRLASNSDKVLMLGGNHEARLERLTRRHINMDILASMLQAPSNVEVSPYHYCTYNDSWIVGHPSSFSSIVGSVPRLLSHKYDANVITGHEHHYATIVGGNGKYIAASVGAMADVKRFSYAGRRLSSAPKQMQGFAVIKRDPETGVDYFYNFTPGFTDFERMLSLHD